MEAFSITTRLTGKEYSKVMFSGLYRKPWYILASIAGACSIVSVILNYFHIIIFYSETPYFEFFGGLFLLLFPLLIVLMALKHFRSDPNLQHGITYTFSESGVVVQGITFKAELKWAHIIKRKEIDKFLLLYQSKMAGNYIDKTKLTKEQLQFIRSKVRGK